MVKRSIQTAKPGYCVGIEYDHLAIRAARLLSDGRGSFSIGRLEEIRGDFSEEATLLDGLRQLKTKLSIGIKDILVTCLAGKLVFASEIPFRRLSQEEMEQALRLELRKTVHFEVATSTIDYEILSEDGDSNDGMTQVLVAVASNSLLQRQLKLFERSGMKPSCVDVLPIAIANALWTWKAGAEGNHPLVALHFGPQVSTIVIDGEHSFFFNRNIYFAAEEIFSVNSSATDREKRIKSLCDEVSRSLLFYEKNSGLSGFQEIVIFGEHMEEPDLIDRLIWATGLKVRKMDLCSRLGSTQEIHPGKYDLAVALAVRSEI